MRGFVGFGCFNDLAKQVENNNGTPSGMNHHGSILGKESRNEQVVKKYKCLKHFEKPLKNKNCIL